MIEVNRILLILILSYRPKEATNSLVLHCLGTAFELLGDISHGQPKHAPDNLK